MKKINKFTCIASVLAMLTSAAALPVSAEAVNDYSVSYETLTQALTADDGTVIPAGSVAVTMTVSNNTGFNANTLTLDIKEGYAAVINDEGKPVVQTGSILENALTAAALSSDGTTLCLATASSSVCHKDGMLFTVYFSPYTNSPNYAFAVLNLKEPVVAEESLTCHTAGSAAAPMGTSGFYYVGDTDGLDANGICRINASDAADVMIAVADKGPISILPPTSATVALIYGCFPRAAYFQAPDADQNYVIDNVDAADILDYSATLGAGNTYTGPIGRRIPFLDDMR